MSQISQIVSTATKRWQVETSLQQSQRTMQKVLDNINANIFVSDYDTLKVILPISLSGKKQEKFRKMRNVGEC